MAKSHKPIVKLVSTALVMAFFIQELSLAAPLEGVTPVPGVSRPMDIIAQDPTLFQAPSQFVTMREVHKGPPQSVGGQAPPFIIHIQDAHTNLSGQQNMAAALDEIMSKYKVSMVLSEGGANDCSLTPIKSIAPKEVWEKVAKSYLIQGEISGEEYLNLVSDHPMKIMGIEDMGLYIKSVENYGKLADKRQDILEYLKIVQRSLDKLKNKFYPSELLDYEKNKTSGNDPDSKSFETSFTQLIDLAKSKNVDISLFPGLTQLASVMEKEKEIDFTAANLEQGVLIEEIAQRGGKDSLEEHFKKMGEMKDKKAALFTYFQNTLSIAKEKNINVNNYQNLMKYLDYLRAFSDIDLDQVLDQLLKAEDKVYSEMLSADSVERIADSISPDTLNAKRSTLGTDSKLIRAIDRFIGLLKTAYNIQMTTKEFDSFEVNEPDFSTISYLAFINRKLAETGYFEDLVPYQNNLDEGKKALEAFYDSVSQRDVAFIENTEKILKDEKTSHPSSLASHPSSQVAIMITGGYHTQNLKKLFKEKGYSYAVLTPLITSETNQKKYENRLLSPIRGKAKKVETVQGESRENQKSLSALDKDLTKPRKEVSGVKVAMASLGLDIALLKGMLDNPGKISGVQREDTVRLIQSKWEFINQLIGTLEKAGAVDKKQLQIVRTSLAETANLLRQVRESKQEIAQPAGLPADASVAGARLAEMTDRDIEDLWGEIQNEHILYHGTSVNNLNSIKQYGLDPARKPFDLDEVDFYERMHLKVFGEKSPLPDRHRSGIFYLTTNEQNAMDYARNGPEVIALMLSQIPKIIGSNKLSRDEDQQLKAIEQKYKDWMSDHQPVVIKIKGTVLQGSNLPIFKTKENFIAEAKRVREAYHRAEGLELSKSEFKEMILLGIEAQVERVSVGNILVSELTRGARLATKPGTDARFEARNLREEEAIQSVANSYNVLAVHGFKKEAVVGDNSLLKPGVNWQERLKILLSFQPTVSTSTFRLGKDTSRNLWSPIGVILKGGEVQSAYPQDAGTIAQSFVKRQEWGRKSEPIADQLDRAINARDELGYNELIISEPEIAGFYIHLGDSNETSGFLTPESEIDPKEIFDFAREVGVPVFVIQDGDVFTAELTTERIGLLDTYEVPKINKGEKLSIEAIMQDGTGITQSKKLEMKQQILHNIPFKQKGLIPSYLRGWADGRHNYMVSHGPQILRDPLGGIEVNFKRVDFADYESGIKVGEPVREISSYPEDGSRASYFIHGNDIWWQEERLRPDPRKGMRILWRVASMQGDQVTTASLRFGSVFIPVWTAVNVTSTDKYLEVVRGALDKLETTIKEQQEDGRDTTRHEEARMMLAANLHGFAKQAEEFGDQDARDRALELAREIIPEEGEGRYLKIPGERLGPNGEFHMSEDELMDAMDTVRSEGARLAKIDMNQGLRKGKSSLLLGDSLNFISDVVLNWQALKNDSLDNINSEVTRLLERDPKYKEHTVFELVIKIKELLLKLRSAAQEEGEIDESPYSKWNQVRKRFSEIARIAGPYKRGIGLSETMKPEDLSQISGLVELSAKYFVTAKPSTGSRLANLEGLRLKVVEARNYRNDTLGKIAGRERAVTPSELNEEKKEMYELERAVRKAEGSLAEGIYETISSIESQNGSAAIETIKRLSPSAGKFSITNPQGLVEILARKLIVHPIAGENSVDLQSFKIAFREEGDELVGAVSFLFPSGSLPIASIRLKGIKINQPLAENESVSLEVKVIDEDKIVSSLQNILAALQFSDTDVSRAGARLTTQRGEPETPAVNLAGARLADLVFGQDVSQIKEQILGLQVLLNETSDKRIELKSALAGIKNIRSMINAKKDQDSGEYKYNALNRYNGLAKISFLLIQLPVRWYGSETMDRADIVKLPTEFHISTFDYLEILNNIRTDMRGLADQLAKEVKSSGAEEDHVAYLNGTLEYLDDISANIQKQTDDILAGKKRETPASPAVVQKPKSVDRVPSEPSAQDRLHAAQAQALVTYFQSVWDEKKIGEQYPGGVKADRSLVTFYYSPENTSYSFDVSNEDIRHELELMAMLTSTKAKYLMNVIESVTGARLAAPDKKGLLINSDEAAQNIKSALREQQIVLVGESHRGGREHDAFMDYIEIAAEAGIKFSIALEIPYQLEDTLNDQNKTVDEIINELQAISKFNLLIPGLLKIIPVARKYKILILAIDDGKVSPYATQGNNFNGVGGNKSTRDDWMAYRLSEGIKKYENKAILTLVGDFHVQKDAVPLRLRQMGKEHISIVMEPKAWRGLEHYFDFLINTGARLAAGRTGFGWIRTMLRKIRPSNERFEKLVAGLVLRSPNSWLARSILKDEGEKLIGRKIRLNRTNLAVFARAIEPAVRLRVGDEEFGKFLSTGVDDNSLKKVENSVGEIIGNALNLAGSPSFETHFYRGDTVWYEALQQFLKDLIMERVAKQDFKLRVKDFGTSFGGNVFSVAEMIYSSLERYASENLGPYDPKKVQQWIGQWDVKIDAYDVRLESLIGSKATVIANAKEDRKPFYEKWVRPIFMDLTDPKDYPLIHFDEQGADVVFVTNVLEVIIEKFNKSFDPGEFQSQLEKEGFEQQRGGFYIKTEGVDQYNYRILSPSEAPKSPIGARLAAGDKPVRDLPQVNGKLFQGSVDQVTDALAKEYENLWKSESVILASVYFFGENVQAAVSGRWAGRGPSSTAVEHNVLAHYAGFPGYTSFTLKIDPVSKAPQVIILANVLSSSKIKMRDDTIQTARFAVQFLKKIGINGPVAVSVLDQIFESTPADLDSVALETLSTEQPGPGARLTTQHGEPETPAVNLAGARLATELKPSIFSFILHSDLIARGQEVLIKPVNQAEVSGRIIGIDETADLFTVHLDNGGVYGNADGNIPIESILPASEVIVTFYDKSTGVQKTVQDGILKIEGLPDGEVRIELQNGNQYASKGSPTMVEFISVALVSGARLAAGQPTGVTEKELKEALNQDLYAYLGIIGEKAKEEATGTTITAAYFKKVRDGAHPDKGGTQKEFNSVNLAYRILIDPETKEQYDLFSPSGKNYDPLKAALDRLKTASFGNSPKEKDIQRRLFDEGLTNEFLLAVVEGPNIRRSDRYVMTSQLDRHPGYDLLGGTFSVGEAVFSSPRIENDSGTMSIILFRQDRGLESEITIAVYKDNKMFVFQHDHANNLEVLEDVNSKAFAEALMNRLRASADEAEALYAQGVAFADTLYREMPWLNQIASPRADRIKTALAVVYAGKQSEAPVRESLLSNKKALLDGSIYPTVLILGPRGARLAILKPNDLLPFSFNENLEVILGDTRLLVSVLGNTVSIEEPATGNKLNKELFRSGDTISVGRSPSPANNLQAGEYNSSFSRKQFLIGFVSPGRFSIHNIGSNAIEVRLGQAPHSQGARLAAGEDRFLNGARFAQDEVKTKQRVLEAQNDKESNALLARFYVAKSKSLKGIFYNFLYSLRNWNTTIKFVEEIEEAKDKTGKTVKLTKVFVEFYARADLTAGEWEPVDRFEITDEVAQAKVTLTKAEVTTTIFSDAYQLTAPATEFGSLHRLGAKVLGTIKNTAPLILTLTMDEDMSEKQLEFIMRMKTVTQALTKNVFFEFVDKEGKNQLGSDDIDSVMANFGKVQRVRMTAAEAMSFNLGERVLPFQKSSQGKNEVDLLPYSAMFIAAILVGRMDSVEGNDLAIQFFTRLTGTKFNQALFNLLVKPDASKKNLYLTIAVKRIAKIAIDKFLEFTKLALQAVGAAA